MRQVDLVFSLQNDKKTYTTVGVEHFGTNIEVQAHSLTEGTSVATIVEKIAPTYLRYPGGTHTETSFDLRNPNGGTLQTKLSDFLAFADANDIKTVIVIPTQTFFSRDTRQLATGAEDIIRNFVRDLLNGAYGPVDIHAFEIGNEWFDDRWARVGNNPNDSGWTAAEFGRLQARIVGIIDEEVDQFLTRNTSSSELNIWVQSQGNGVADVDKNGLDDRVEIRTAMNNVMNAVDGVVDHFYQPARQDTPLAVYLNGPMPPSERSARLDRDGWDVLGPDATLDLITTEWNVRAARGPVDGPPIITGLERLPLFLALFVDMIRVGVDDAMVFTAQEGNGANASPGTLSDYNETTLTPVGHFAFGGGHGLATTKQRH